MKQDAKIRKKVRTIDLNVKPAVLIFILIAQIFLITPVSADGGMIPWTDFSVYEPGQKAIIAWDGYQEIMILSVDVYSEQSTKALHMVPFPSLPEVSLGSTDAFEKIDEIIISHGRYDDYDHDSGNQALAAPEAGVEIIFTEKIGPHDITTVQVYSPQDFTDWVNEFLKSKGITGKNMPAGMNDVIEHYTHQNINYFVFDVIELDPNGKSVDPIIYRFTSSYLFFPLEISSIIEGDTTISIALIMPPDLPINIAPLSELGFSSRFDKLIPYEEIKEVDDQIAAMFSSEKVSLRVYKGYFELNELENDVVIEKLKNVNWMCPDLGNYYNHQTIDYDDDNEMEIVVASSGKIIVFDAVDGDLEREIYFDYDLLINSDVQNLVDINSDGILDIITTSYHESMITGHIQRNAINALDGNNGDQIWEYLNESLTGTIAISGVVIDNSDGNRDFKVVCYTSGSGSNKIIVLDGEKGHIIWAREIADYISPDVSKDMARINRVRIGDINEDNQKDLVILFDKGAKYVIAINIENGNNIWPDAIQIGYEYFPYGFLLADVSDEAGQEIVYLQDDLLTVLKGPSGLELWSFEWAAFSVRYIHLIDIEQDGYSEIILHGENTFAIINGTSSDVIYKIDFDTEVDYWAIYSVADVDSDNEPELIISSRSHIYFYDLNDDRDIPEFTTGEYIRGYDICDLDSDGTEELIISANNKLYVVDDLGNKGSTYSGDDELIIIQTVILPIALILFLTVLIAFLFMFGQKKIGKRKRR